MERRSRSNSRKYSKKHSKKSSRKSKRHRRSRSRSRTSYDDDDNKYKNSNDLSSNFKIVEYSDVSSEDFSAPEAGEIDDEENAFGDRGQIDTKPNGNPGNQSRIFCDIGGGGIGSGGGDQSMNSNRIQNSGLSSVVVSGNVGTASGTPNQRKIIVGSPISSSLSSNSRSKHRSSASPIDYDSERRIHLKENRKARNITSPLGDDNDDDDDEDDASISDGSEILRKRKKGKKSKKKKSKKKRKKKRTKSISSIENISDNDSVLDDDCINLTPPLRKHDSMSRSPITTPLRPNSNISIYSETSRRTPPLSQKYTVSSPHTPPLVPRKSTNVTYHNMSPIDVDVPLSGNHSHSHFHHHGYHHSSRSSPGKESLTSTSRRSKTPRKHTFQFFPSFPSSFFSPHFIQINESKQINLCRKKKLQ